MKTAALQRDRCPTSKEMKYGTSAYDGALAAASDIEYDDQFEVWFSEANVTYYYDRFKSNYISPAVPKQK